MKRQSFRHLTHAVLLSTLIAALRQERVCVVLVVALLAEVDRRRLYAPDGYPSMYRYCVGRFQMSEDSAFKRIRAARAARRFPEILDALEAGRLHLRALVMLAPHLRPGNVSELMAAATHRTKVEIRKMLAERFPQADVPSSVEAIAQSSQALTLGQLAPGPVGTGEDVAPSGAESEGALAPSGQTGDAHDAPGRVPDQPADPATAAPPDFPRLTPLAPRRFAVQFTMDQATHDELVRAQELLSHRLPSGDIAEVFALALQALNRDLMKQKFAATDQPRAAARPSDDPRHVPAEVKRAV